MILHNPPLDLRRPVHSRSDIHSIIIILWICDKRIYKVCQIKCVLLKHYWSALRLPDWVISDCFTEQSDRWPKWIAHWKAWPPTWGHTCHWWINFNWFYQVGLISLWNVDTFFLMVIFCAVDNFGSDLCMVFIKGSCGQKSLTFFIGHSNT
jgi:hypothetical protein